MALSGDKQRRNLTLPEVLWQVIDAEADEVRAPWFAVVQARLAEVFQGEADARVTFGPLERRFDQIDGQLEEVKSAVQGVVEVLTQWLQAQKEAKEPGQSIDDAFAGHYGVQLKAMVETQPPDVEAAEVPKKRSWWR